MVNANQFQFQFGNELIVDLFAGGGGASLGIEQAFGRPVDVCVNHNAEAVQMHMANHPRTQHYCADVFEVDPLEATKGRAVGLLWASPDCKHFSKAKGGKPVEKKIRGLAWVVVAWAKAVRPRVIILENVEEFQTWGPLTAESKPCQARRGETFREWLSELRALGYAVAHRELRACDYGAPTIRKRFFLIARCDGRPIVWPKPSHGKPGTLEVKKGKLKPWLTAASCIDWSILCPSIFERSKPLAEATLRRIAKGIMRFVVECAEPFIVPVTHHGSDRVHPTSDPLRTVTAAQRGEFALGTAYLDRQFGASVGTAGDAPVGTVTAGGGGKSALVSAVLAKHYTGVVGNDVREPIGTVTSVDHHSVVTANLESATLVHMGHGEQANGARRWSHGVRDIEEPLNTVTASGMCAGLVTAVLVKTNFEATYECNASIKRANSSRAYGSESGWNNLEACSSKQSAVSDSDNTEKSRAHGESWISDGENGVAREILFTERAFGGPRDSKGSSSEGDGGKPRGWNQIQQSPKQSGSDVPIKQHVSRLSNRIEETADAYTRSDNCPGITGSENTSFRGAALPGNCHSPSYISNDGLPSGASRVYAFITAYYGTEQAPRLDAPAHTIPTHDRFGLVTVHGELYQIADIGLRMLQPRELFRAQGFPDTYIIDRGADGREMTKTAQVRMCGNSVCPPMAKALVEANVGALVELEKRLSA